MKRRAFFLGVLTFLATGLCSPAQDDVGYKVVIHADNPTLTLDQKKVSNMFLKKAPRWSDGVRHSLGAIETPLRTKERSDPLGHCA